MINPTFNFQSEGEKKTKRIWFVPGPSERESIWKSNGTGDLNTQVENNKYLPTFLIPLLSGLESIYDTDVLRIND